MESAVSKSVAAFIGIQRSSGGHEAWVPDGVPFFYVIVFSVGIGWNIVVAVTCDTKELGIFIEAVASAGVGNQGEEILGAKVIDPWQWGIWCGNDVFFTDVIKMSEFHKWTSFY